MGACGAAGSDAGPGRVVAGHWTDSSFGTALIASAAVCVCHQDRREKFKRPLVISNDYNAGRCSQPDNKEIPMGQRTPLYDLHVALGAKLVDFGGWDMPLHYGSQVEEHHQVRRDCGVFDVSHMTIVDIDGAQAEGYLSRLLVGDVARLSAPGKALYSIMLNAHGGVVDDLILYRLEQGYRLVTNASTREKVLIWLDVQSEGYAVTLTPRPELAILAIQGPEAREKVADVVSPERAELIRSLKPFQAMPEGQWFIARTGYTGEDGLEIILPADEVVSFMNELVGAGIGPVGLGARDTLRLEAGLNLYGHEMDEHVSPLASNLDWTIAWAPEGRDFIGRKALEEERNAGPRSRLVGLVLEERGVLRAHQVVRIAGCGEGEITSGSYAPTLGKSIALARVPVETGDRAEVEIRGKWLPVRVVKPCFVRFGKTLI